MGIMTAELLELGSCFELVSSPEAKDRKVAALRHGFVHLCGSCATAAPRRRALSAEARPSFEAEELAFARYVATFHFCRSSESDNGVASPTGGAKTPTGARQALAEFAIPWVELDGSSCGGDDAEVSTEEPSSSQPSPTNTVEAAASPQSAACAADSVDVFTEEPCSAFLPAHASVVSLPIATSSSQIEGLQAEVTSLPRRPEMILPVIRCASLGKVDLVRSHASRLRKDAPVFVPGNFGPQPSPASDSPVKRGPLSTMPPSSPGGSFEAGARVPPPPPTSPPRVVPPAGPPGAFHSPPPRGVAGTSTTSQLPQHVPMPPTTAPKLTHALLRGSAVDKCLQGASVEDHSEYASLASHDSSTTAPPSIEEVSEAPEVVRHATLAEVQRSHRRPPAGQGHFSQGRAGPRERPGIAPAAIDTSWDEDVKEDGASMRKKSTTSSGSPSNSRNLVWRPKKRSAA